MGSGKDDAKQGGGGQARRTKEVYHFVSYIPKNGFLWELDSLNENPIKVKTIEKGENWLTLLKPIILEKALASKHDVTTMAVMKDFLPEKKEQRRVLLAYNQKLDAKLSKEILNPDRVGTAGDIGLSNLTSKGREIQQVQKNMKALIAQLAADIADLEEEEADRTRIVEKFRKPFLPATTSKTTSKSKPGSTESKHSPQTSTKKGKGNDKSKSSPQGPKSKEDIIKVSASKVSKPKKDEKVASRKSSRINKDGSNHEEIKEKIKTFITNDAKKT
jgi:hypothetical protein